MEQLVEEDFYDLGVNDEGEGDVLLLVFAVGEDEEAIFDFLDVDVQRCHWKDYSTWNDILVYTLLLYWLLWDYANKLLW